MPDIVYALKVVDTAGTVYGTLDNARITSITRELNGFGGCVFTVPILDPSTALLTGYLTQREVQVWRDDGSGPDLIFWGPVVRARATPQTTEFQAMGLLWYFSRLHFGPPIAEDLTNGNMEAGTTGWTAVGATMTADTTIVCQGTTSLQLVSSAKGLDQYATQTFAQAGGSFGTVIMAAASFYQVATFATPYIGPAGPMTGLGTVFLPAARGLMVRVFDGSGTLLVEEWTRITPDSPRNQWTRIYAPAVVMPAGVTGTVEVRLYSPGGEIHWDMGTTRGNENVSSIATPGAATGDVNILLAAVVDYAQAGFLNKPALNIDPPSGTFGVELFRVYNYSDLGNIWDACFSELIASGICDLDIVWNSLGTTRQLVSYPQKGTTRAGLPLTLVSASTDNIVDFSYDVDGQATAGAVVVLPQSTATTPVLGTVQPAAQFFGYAVDVAANGGITLDDVVTTQVETPPDGVQLKASTELARVKNGVTVPSLTVVDTPGVALVGVIETGDQLPVTMDWGFVQEAGTYYRVTAWTLTPEAESLALVMGPPLPGTPRVPPSTQAQIAQKAVGLAALFRQPQLRPPSIDQLAGAALGYMSNAQGVAYDATTGLIVPANPADIVFSLPGAVTVSTSPPVTPRDTINAVGLSVTLGTAGSTTTTVELLKNGSTVATVNLGAGATYGTATFTAAVTFTARTDTYAISVTAAGTGAADLGGGIELG